MSKSFGLTREEKAGAKELLRLLPDAELRSLSETVTNRQILTKTKAEAIRAILTYAESPVALLKRRKVKRELMVQYLHGKGATFSPQADKGQLVRTVLQLWGSKEGNAPIDFQEEPEQEPADQVRQRQKPEPADQTGLRLQLSENQELAKQFTTWFYRTLNSQNPTDPSPSPFGPQHFFRDCFMKLLCAAPQTRLEEIRGAEMVSNRLLALVKEEKVLFNPNTDPDGLSGISDAHGRKIVTVCGTVHHGGSVVGLFEQQFGLVRDPEMQDNFRVQFTNLKFGVGKQLKRPTLEATETLLAIGGP